MTTKTAPAVVYLVLFFSTVLMAQDNNKNDSANPVGSPKKVESLTPSISVEPMKAEAVPVIKRQRLETGEIPRSYTKKMNAALMAALWTATALDIHSSSRLDPTRYHEVNKFGSKGGQIATTAIATGTAFLVDRYGQKRWRWLSSLLLSGATAGHAFGAIHNYGLR